MEHTGELCMMVVTPVEALHVNLFGETVQNYSRCRAVILARTKRLNRYDQQRNLHSSFKGCRSKGLEPDFFPYQRDSVRGVRDSALRVWKFTQVDEFRMLVQI